MSERSEKSSSKIPILSPAPLRRSGSLRLRTCPPIQEHNNIGPPKLNRHHSLQSLNKPSSAGHEREDDCDSVRSFSSSASVCSTLSQCEHSTFARNGTTYSGRSNRYVVHCSNHSFDSDDYLTPTQRTSRTIRRLKSLLRDAQVQLTEKDKDIARLTKEVVELRLLKADSGVEQSDQDKDTKAESQAPGTAAKERQIDNYATSSPLPPIRYCATPPLTQSLSDSGHFEDLNSSKENSHASQSHVLHLKALETLQRQHEDEIRELKEKHFDKVESLLQRITDVNDRYYALRPLYEECKEKVLRLEKLNEELKNSSCQDHCAKIIDLEKGNDDLNKEKNALISELTILRTSSLNIESITNKYDKLKTDFEELKSKHEKLQVDIINGKEEVTLLKETKCSVNQTVQTEELTIKQDNFINETHKTCSDKIIQTEFLTNSVSDKNVETEISTDSRGQNTDGVDEHDHSCSFREESTRLSAQVEAHVEKLKQLEEQQSCEKNLYVQLYNKGFQAAKLENSQEVNGDAEPQSEVSLVPELLQKLEIKQEELDNIKDKEYFSSVRLLSAKEAGRLWLLARKSMYRRLLEQKKHQPRNDPEMTLQFLKSAIYYFLTDRENAPGHLSAIESILAFSDTEKSNVDRAFLWR